MSARVDAVASRVQTAVTTKRVTSSMQGVVKAMDSAMKSMNLEKISNLMDKFEKEFEDLDVQTSVMEGAMVSHAFQIFLIIKTHLIFQILILESNHCYECSSRSC